MGTTKPALTTSLRRFAKEVPSLRFLPVIKLLPLLLWLGGCQSLVEVHIFNEVPHFDWKAGVKVVSLKVLASADCQDVHGSSYQDRVWWEITGEFVSPVTYGVVPSGAQQVAGPRPLNTSCNSWQVTVTDANLKPEMANFNFKKSSPLPM